MTPASAARSALVLALVVVALFLVDVVFGVGWPSRSPEIVRGLVGALSVLAVGALFFASRESGSAREPRALVAVVAGLVGTVAVLIGVGLLSAVPPDRAGDVFVHPGIGGPGVLVLLAGAVVAAARWRPEH